MTRKGTDTRRPAPAARLRNNNGKASTFGLGILAAILAALGIWFTVGPRHNHDDPIVVDNSQVRIHRVKHDPGRWWLTKGWSLGDMATLKSISIKAWYNGSGPPLEYTTDVSPDTQFAFSMIVAGGPKEPAFVIRKGTTAGLFPKVVIDPNGELEFERESNTKKIKPKLGTDHIGQITFGGKSVCMADKDGTGKGAILERACQAWNITPDKLQVVITLKE
jgi:hypothetical protein